jgi:hypothetical protein
MSDSGGVDSEVEEQALARAAVGTANLDEAEEKGVQALASEQTELKWGTETGPQTARDGFKALLDSVSAELQECRTALEQALTDSRRAMAGYEANEEDIAARLASAFPGEAYGAGPQAVGDGTADYGAH